MNANTAAQAVRDDLEARGFTLETDDGRLWVRPADRLTDDDRAAIRACRDDLYRIAAGAIAAIDDVIDNVIDDGEHQRAEQGDDDLGPPIPCDWRGWREGCLGEAVRDGRHLCRACLAAWDAGERAPATASTAATIGLHREWAA